MDKPKIALALGSGGARGWAHIGVIEVLQEHGIQAQIVCGSSIGSLVGGAYASGELPRLREWTESLTWKDIVTLLDVSLAKGGLIEGEKVLKRLQESFMDQPIEKLSMQYTAVATELETGREVWIRSGSLFKAMRASFALPGLFTPIKRGEKWLTDGGLVNPVPVSACRALGADFIIAVNLNGDIASKRIKRQQANALARRSSLESLAEQWLPEPLAKGANNLIQKALTPEDEAPGYTDVMISAINIMQDRITRSRMAGDPPDILISPRLGHLGVMDYDSAKESITVGRECALQAMPNIQAMLENV